MEINYSRILINSLPSIIKILYPTFLLLALVVILKISYLIFQYLRFRKAGIFEIDKMSGTDFERYLTTLFIRLRYKVNHVGSLAGDYGADLIIEKDGIKTIVQAKRYNTFVGIDSVRETYGAINYYKANKAMVVTNNYFTNQAKILAKSNNVILWDRNDLTKNILSK